MSEGYEPTGELFQNPYTQELLLVTEGANAGWLCARHADGQWVLLLDCNPICGAKQLKAAQKEVYNYLIGWYPQTLGMPPPTFRQVLKGIRIIKQYRGGKEAHE